MKLDIAINYVCSWLFFDVSTLKHVLIASDCVIKKDVTTMPLLIYYDELYMLHPLISALILET